MLLILLLLSPVVAPLVLLLLPPLKFKERPGELPSFNKLFSDAARCGNFLSLGLSM
jgi:hypothetical protein